MATRPQTQNPDFSPISRSFYGKSFFFGVTIGNSSNSFLKQAGSIISLKNPNGDGNMGTEAERQMLSIIDKVHTSL